MTYRAKLTTAILGAALLLAPVSGLADSSKGKGNGKGGPNKVAVNGAKVKGAKGDHVVDNVARAGCPPGLAKKTPACIPPGQAKKYVGGPLSVGDYIDWDHAHVITRPGRYGLSTPPEGDRYAVIDGRLVRVNSDTGKVLSILRLVNEILD